MYKLDTDNTIQPTAAKMTTESTAVGRPG